MSPPVYFVLSSATYSYSPTVKVKPIVCGVRLRNWGRLDESVSVGIYGLGVKFKCR
jgi:hypothetical protein